MRVMSGKSVAVSALGAGRWRVEVQADSRSTHEVTIPAGYLEKLGVAAAAPERVLEESFRFLLEREPNTSILSRFDLPVIARYFPEYERDIARRLR
jgi:hypothetical protein